MIQVAIALALALLLGLAPAGLAADTPRTEMHSGTVVTIDPGAAVLVLEEIGPGRGEGGGNVVLRQKIVLTAATKYASFIRVTVPGAFAGDFLEVELEADNLTPGEFVTAHCVREGGRLVALRVSVAETH
jgi:hypothetical protein